MFKCLSAIALILTSTAALARVTVSDATARPATTRASVVAVVTADRPDVLTGGSSPAARVVMAHTVARGGAMAPVGIPLAKAVPRRLSVHGYHVMFMGLVRPLRAGDRVPVTLTFANSPSVTVQVRVQ